MKRIDCVSSEGVPILIVDAVIAQSWCGYEEKVDDDFMRGCEAVASSPGVVALPIGEGMGRIWDFGGAGTCDVFRDGDNVVFVRPWLEDCEQSEEDGIMLRFAEVPRKNDLALTDLPRAAIAWTTCPRGKRPPSILFRATCYRTR